MPVPTFDDDAELAAELKGSLLVLTTTSPDKRDLYRQMFSSLREPGQTGDGRLKASHMRTGLDLHVIDSGAFGIAPRKTPEKQSDYLKNLEEKRVNQLPKLRKMEGAIRASLAKDNEFDPATVRLVGMTEDHGWNLLFTDANDVPNKGKEKKFIDIVTDKLKKKLREKDYWLLDNLEQTGFPGPNFKPLTEHLEGGFHTLMTLIYDTADEMGLDQLKLRNNLNVAFTGVESGKTYTRSFTSDSWVLRREEYDEGLTHIKRGEAIDSHFIQIPYGQSGGQGGGQPLDELVRSGIHTLPGQELPADYARRDFAQYLQQLIGSRITSEAERKRPVNVGYVQPDLLIKPEHRIRTVQGPMINDMNPTGMPSYAKLREYPGIKLMGDADVVVLMPDDAAPLEYIGLSTKPNLEMVVSFITTIKTDPRSMRVPLILDNRSRKFDTILDLISDAYAQGRLAGKPPYVANSDAELEAYLEEVKHFRQRAPVLKAEKFNASEKKEVDAIPNDGTFTVFIGGGHDNNSERDLQDARRLGYLCAENGWRIITGAGAIDGSMGAVHTGFIEFHLKKFLATSPRAFPEDVRDLHKKLREKFAPEGILLDPEAVIEEAPELINALADKDIIPRDMFYGYSLQPFLDMESLSGEPPPGITFMDAGNRVRRLDHLLSSGTKVILPGSIGTDEEFVQTMRQHQDARKQGNEGEPAFADGTDNKDGAIFILNRNGHMNKLLSEYDLLGNNVLTAATKKTHSIQTHESLQTLFSSLKTRAEAWKKSWRERAEKSEPPSTQMRG